MPRAKGPKRPAPVEHQGVRGRVMRGPKPHAPEVWYWRFHQTSDGEKRNLGTVWGTREQAEAHAAVLFGSGRKRPTGPPVTVYQACNRWFFEQKNRPGANPKTIANKKSATARISAVIGEVRLDRLDLLAMESFRDERLRDPKRGAPKTVLLDLMTLRMVWEWARKRGWTPDRALPQPELKKRNVREKYTPPAGDVAATLEQLQGYTRAFVFLLWSTGCRLGEAADLLVEHVDLAGAIMRVSGKTGPRDVDLPPETVAALRPFVEGKAPGSRVWPVTGTTLRVHVAATVLPTACAKAKVKRFTPHGLRRAAVDRYIRAGVDVSVAAELLGHDPTVLLREYRQVTAADRKAAVRKAKLGVLPGKVLKGPWKA